ncbi:MAG: glycosyltransferase family 4 protein [Tepidisphaeraceae bacterium]|jgi:glycosyltransferase involved in cell wall biosynthesis
MPEPVFAFLAFTSGSYEGAIIRDMRLANALHRRKFKVLIYWMMETNSELVDPGIEQHVLVRGLRFYSRKPSPLLDQTARIFNITPLARRRRFMQEHPGVVARGLENFVRSMCDGGDPGLIQRLENFLIRDHVTHLLPTFAMCCPLALAVKERKKHEFEYLPTFQGEEIFANYAEMAGRLEDYFAQLRRVMAGSPWPSVVVSDDYAARLQQEMNLDRSRMTTIYPGIELPGDRAKPPFSVFAEKLPGLDPTIPIVTYFGRQDTEKGIDLLLYAARLVRETGLKFQLVICGGSSFGWGYQDACKQIAHHLRLPIHWKRRISDEMRAGLYAYSRFIVYPSIHREPFGMVAAETMSWGTPVIIPDHGGVTEAIRAGDCVGGLMFKVWDTRDLAEQMIRLLKDDALHASLSADTRKIAATFSVEAMTDRVLAHMGISTFSPSPGNPGEGRGEGGI